MKKVVALLLALVMMLCLVACGGDEKKPEAPASPAEVKGETYDTGAFTALIPEGWLAVPVSDMWSDDANAKDPSALQIIKGGESEWDLFTKPYIQINHYGPEEEMMEPWKDMYDGATDIAEFTTGALTWKGFTAKDLLENEMMILWTAGDAAGNQYTLTAYAKTDAGSFTVQDADVQALLGSLAGK